MKSIKDPAKIHGLRTYLLLLKKRTGAKNVDEQRVDDRNREGQEAADQQQPPLLSTGRNDQNDI